MNATLRALLADAVDYAGLFPPAALDMVDAVRNYASYRGGQSAWMLGRFVVPIARLGEFTAARSDVASRGEWPLSGLLGADGVADIVRAKEFNARVHGQARVDSLEGRFNDPAAIMDAARAAGPDFTLYVEIGPGPSLEPLIRATGEAGAAAKIRTGGVTTDAFPTAEFVVKFIRCCLDSSVPFKATAGLHHPLRGVYPLTYDANAQTGMMFGFLNVFLATAFLASGLSERDAISLLCETDASAVRFDGSAVTWRGHSIATVPALRTRSPASFGSCSFTEPVEELRALAITA